MKKLHVVALSALLTSLCGLTAAHAQTVTCSQLPALTGDVTTPGASCATTIASGVVTSGKMASGAAIGNIGYTPLNVASDLSDIHSPSAARGNLGFNITGILKGNGASAPSAAVAGTDYLAPNGDGSLLTNLPPCMYSAGGTGSVTRTCASKIGEWISVTDFGAVMNNTSVDYTTNVQAAINRASALGIAEVRIPGGTIKLGQLTVPSNIWIHGAAVNGTAIFMTSATASLFVASDATAMEYVRISDLSIYSSNGGATPQTAGFYFLYQNCSTCRIDHVAMSNAYVSAQIDGSATEDTIEDVTSTGAGLAHFIISGGTDHRLSKVLVRLRGDGTQAGAGLSITQSGGTWVTDSDFVGAGTGVVLQPAAGKSVKWTFITNTALGDSGNSNGLFINPNGSGAVIYGVKLANTWTSSNQLNGVRIACAAGGSVDGVELIGHHSIDNHNAGFLAECGKNIHINGGTFISNGSASSGVYSGLTFVGGLTHFGVLGVNCAASFGDAALQKYCVEVQSGAGDYYNILYNDGVGGTTTGTTVSDSGGGTHKNITGNF
jgi:hypothetical protein